MESEDELPSLSSTWRVPRAVTLIVVSSLTITGVGINYLHPNISFGSAGLQAARADKLPASNQLAAVDFVTPAIGWVVEELQPQDFAILHTTDAGMSWKRQLTGSAGAVGEYVRFFDSAHGVLVLFGPQAALYQTNDGGSTWGWQSLTQRGGYIWSADFVDASHGWLLAQASTDGTSHETLWRTDDGGRTWIGLGNPVLSRDWAYRVVFSDSSVGWLYSQSAEPYAYKSLDGGTTWRRVALPAPPRGWPAAQLGSVSTDEFFVAAHPTHGAGVLTTVISVAPFDGRSRTGAILQGYPPLTVGTFDGGGRVTDVYPDVSPYRYFSTEHANSGPFVIADPPNQVQLSSVDGGLSWKAVVAPSPHGALGYVDALNWWWIGSGARSTSSDAGRTWTGIRSMGVPEPMPGSLQFIDATHAWFGAMAGPRPLVETTDDGGLDWRMILLPAITPT